MAAFHGGQRPCCPEGQAPRPLPSLTDTALPAEAVAPAVPLGFSPVSRPLTAPPVWQCREEVRQPPAPRQGAGGAGSFLRGRRGPHGPPSLQWACGARLPSEAFRGVSEGHMAPSTTGVAGGRGPAACWRCFPGVCCHAGAVCGSQGLGHVDVCALGGAPPSSARCLDGWVGRLCVWSGQSRRACRWARGLPTCTPCAGCWGGLEG